MDYFFRWAQSISQFLSAQRVWVFLSCTYNWATSRVAVGSSILIVSAILSQKASSWSERNAISAWETHHYPRAQVIERIVLSFGFRLIRSEKVLKKVYRSLPSDFNETSLVWISNSQDWVGIQMEKLDPYASQGRTQIYCKFCKELPKFWKSYGRGWGDLEKMLEDLGSRWSLGRTSNATIKSLKDSREIAY